MIDRGTYRSIYCALVDGADFQAFSPGAKLVFYTLKMTLGPSGIDVVPALVPTLVERTGAPTVQVEKAIAQLERAGWVRRERSVVWIVDGLRHEPTLSLDNANHRKRIALHVNGLPRLAIVNAFREHYGLAAPTTEIPLTPSERAADLASKMAANSPSKMPSKEASKGPSTSREREKGKGDGKGARRVAAAGAATGAAGSQGTGRKGHPTWLTPFADAWRARYGGTMFAGKAVKALARLVEEHSADEVLRRWAIYLEATAAEYASAPHFAERWGRYAAPVLRVSGSGGNGRNGLALPPDALARATTLWPRYKAAGLLRQLPRDEYDRIAGELVAAGHYASPSDFLSELRLTEPWTLGDARTDGYAINELARRLATAQGGAA